MSHDLFCVVNSEVVPNIQPYLSKIFYITLSCQKTLSSGVLSAVPSVPCAMAPLLSSSRRRLSKSGFYLDNEPDSTSEHADVVRVRPVSGLRPTCKNAAQHSGAAFCEKKRHVNSSISSGDIGSQVWTCEPFSIHMVPWLAGSCRDGAGAAPGPCLRPSSSW